MQVLLVNLLQLAPMGAGALLLSQLLLMLSVITVTCGWHDWHVDHRARRCGRSHIQFSGADATVPRLDDFQPAVTMQLWFEASGATASTRHRKTVFQVDDLVMLDPVALTPSRAIGLASGGT